MVLVNLLIYHFAQNVELVEKVSVVGSSYFFLDFFDDASVSGAVALNFVDMGIVAFPEFFEELIMCFRVVNCIFLDHLFEDKEFFFFLGGLKRLLL